MPILDALAGVPEDHQVLGLAAGDDEVGLAVAIEVGGLEVFDGDLLGQPRPTLRDSRQEADFGGVSRLGRLRDKRQGRDEE